ILLHRGMNHSVCQTVDKSNPCCCGHSPGDFASLIEAAGKQAASVQWHCDEAMRAYTQPGFEVFCQQLRQYSASAEVSAVLESGDELIQGVPVDKGSHNAAEGRGMLLAVAANSADCHGFRAQ